MGCPGLHPTVSRVPMCFDPAPVILCPYLCVPVASLLRSGRGTVRECPTRHRLLPLPAVEETPVSLDPMRIGRRIVVRDQEESARCCLVASVERSALAESPSLAYRPEVRVVATPPLECSAVPSFEPLPTTTTSHFVPVCCPARLERESAGGDARMGLDQAPARSRTRLPKEAGDRPLSSNPKVGRHALW